MDVVNFCDQCFNMLLTDQEKADLGRVHEHAVSPSFAIADIFPKNSLLGHR